MAEFETAQTGASVKVGVLLGPEQVGLGEWLADAAAFDAAGADALWIQSGPESDVLALTAALAVLTHRSQLMVALPEDATDLALDTISRLSNGRLASEGLDDRWLAVPVPESRTDWQATREDAAERGFAGVVVPADPRMLDILRNPEDPDERRDLQLAQG
jgi:hypothetical protein